MSKSVEKTLKTVKNWQKYRENCEKPPEMYNNSQKIAKNIKKQLINHQKCQKNSQKTDRDFRKPPKIFRNLENTARKLEKQQKNRY